MNSRVAEVAALAQAVGSAGMFGVIWIVQVVTARAGLAIAMLVAVLR